MLFGHSRGSSLPAWLPSTHEKPAKGSIMMRFFTRHLRTVLTFLGLFFVCSVVLKNIKGSQYHGDYFSMLSAASKSSESILITEDTQTAKVGKVSILLGDSDESYERAFNSHIQHNAQFKYPMKVLRKPTIASEWAKPAYLLQTLLTELEKPKEEQLEWLVWFNPETVILNPNIALETFLPPDEWDHIFGIFTNDEEGLSNGVFFLRVNEWSVWFMNSCLGTKTFKPSMELARGDQSLFAFWAHHEHFRNNIVHVPERWFNAQPGHRGQPGDEFADPEKPAYQFRSNSVREGDLLVNLARGDSTTRVQRMEPWLNFSEKHSSAWELNVDSTAYPRDVSNFWLKDASKERKLQDGINAKIRHTKSKKPKKNDHAEPLQVQRFKRM